MLEAVFLYVILHDDNSSGERFRTKMPDMKTCMAAVSNAKISGPKSVAGDYEVMSAMWCGGELHRNYNATWWNDPQQETPK